MAELWDRGEATVRIVLDALNERTSRKRAYTTVMTVLIRLHRKGLVERRKEGRGHVYVASISREEWLEARARAQVGAVVDEFGDLALVHFARRMAELDPRRRDQLRRLARRG